MLVAPASRPVANQDNKHKGRPLMRSTHRAFRVFGISLVAAFSLQANAQELEQLQREWWQWAMAIPASQNPILDKTGNNCGIGQHGDVWFLAGSTGSTLTRACSVPAGARLFVPVVNTFCFPDPAFSEAF